MVRKGERTLNCPLFIRKYPSMAGGNTAAKINPFLHVFHHSLVSQYWWSFCSFSGEEHSIKYLLFFLHWKGIKEIIFLAGDIIVVAVFWSGIDPPLFDSLHLQHKFSVLLTPISLIPDIFCHIVVISQLDHFLPSCLYITWKMLDILRKKKMWCEWVGVCLG